MLPVLIRLRGLFAFGPFPAPMVGFGHGPGGTHPPFAGLWRRKSQYLWDAAPALAGSGLGFAAIRGRGRHPPSTCPTAQFLFRHRLSVRPFGPVCALTDRPVPPSLIEPSALIRGQERFISAPLVKPARRLRAAAAASVFHRYCGCRMLNHWFRSLLSSHSLPPLIFEGVPFPPRQGQEQQSLPQRRR